MVISEIGCTKFKNFQNSWRGGCKSDKGDILREKKKRILVETVEVLFMKIFFAPNMIFPCTDLKFMNILVLYIQQEWFSTQTDL